MPLKEFSDFAVAFPECSNELVTEHLLQHIRGRKLQEDVCFAIWHPSQGRVRLTAVIAEVILPGDGDRVLSGNVCFTESYFRRALTRALESGGGLVLMHSHLGPGWQNLSWDDSASEAGFAGRILAATKLPLVGMTLGTDGAWSARFWLKGARVFEPSWASTVRVVGQKLRVSYHPELKPAPKSLERLRRTVGVWGRQGQANLARLKIGIVGLGSVGSIVSEELARLGIETVALLDFDVVEELNLDRVLNAREASIGKFKVDVAAEAFKSHSNANRPTVYKVKGSIAEDEGYAVALDCDVIFSCVDRHLPRRVLNHIAYAHCIPVIDGGILVRLRRDRLVGADWHVWTIGPGRRCLECLSAYDAATVGLERDGLLDDPSYLARLDKDDLLLRHENVFPFSTSVASLEVLQLAALVLGPIFNIGDQNYHFVTGSMDKNPDRGCDKGCLFTPLIGTADSVVRPVCKDIAVERAMAKLRNE